nr:unnamed protein product [Spirometra erinaceieuropaei]
MSIKTTHKPDTPSNANTGTSADTSGEDLVYTCPHCDRTFTSQIDLSGHLRIHRTGTDKPVPGAQTCIRLHCPRYPRTFMYRMGLFGHMRIQESRIDRNIDTPSTSSTPFDA